MTVYIDLVIILNFFIDLILLLSVNYILRRNCKIGRIIFGSLFGSITLFLLFIKLNFIIMTLFKIIVSFIIVILAFGYRDLKYTIKNIMYFYLVSIILGGGIEFLSNQFKYSNNGLIFTDNGLGISYGVIFIIGLFIFCKYVNCFMELKNNYGNYYKCEIFFDSKQSIMVNAFLDTGNKLKDPYSNKSIIILDKNKVDDIKVRSPVYVPYNSLNNHGLLTCYKGYRIEIDGKSFDKFLIGISDEHFYMDGIDCILNNKIMEGLK